MATIGDIVTKVQSDFLNRDTLTTPLTNRCAEAYQTMCGKVPFDELMVGQESLVTTPGSKNVDLTLLSQPIAGLVSIQIIYSTGHAMRLKRTHVRNYDAMADPPAGRPVQYARWGSIGTRLEIWPIPDQFYTLMIRYWRKPVLSSPVANTVLVIPDAWHELLMYETLYRAYYMLRQPNDAQALIIGSMQPRYPTRKKVFSQDMGIIPRLWNELLVTTSQRENIDEDFSINPLRPIA